MANRDDAKRTSPRGGGRGQYRCPQAHYGRATTGPSGGMEKPPGNDPEGSLPKARDEISGPGACPRFRRNHPWAP